MACCHTDGGSKGKNGWLEALGRFAIKISPGPDDGIRISLLLLIHAREPSVFLKGFSIKTRKTKRKWRILIQQNKISQKHLSDGVFRWRAIKAKNSRRKSEQDTIVSTSTVITLTHLHKLIFILAKGRRRMVFNSAFANWVSYREQTAQTAQTGFSRVCSVHLTTSA